MKKYIWLFVYFVALSLPVTALHLWYEVTSIDPVVVYPVWLQLPFIVLGWPNGVTVWALLLTLLAIAEQSGEARRSADISARVMVAQFRPKLIVRKVAMVKGTRVPTVGIDDAHPWTVNFDIANVGQGRASVLDHAFFVKRGKSGEVVQDSVVVVGGGEPFELEPGEDRRMSIAMPEDLVFILRLISEDALDKGYQNTDSIYFYGIVLYADALGVKRTTAVSRHYDNAHKRFIAVDDPDREYAD